MCMRMLGRGRERAKGKGGECKEELYMLWQEENEEEYEDTRKKEAPCKFTTVPHMRLVVMEDQILPWMDEIPV